MNANSIDLHGAKLVAFFQPYHVNLTRGGRPPHQPGDSRLSGEILTRPNIEVSSIEEFFSELSVDEHFTVLEWHLELAEQLSEQTHTHAAVNLHNSVIQEEEGRARLLELVKSCRAHFTFEFTETYPMPPRTVANTLLRELRRLGHQTALDDFGTGLNGMSLLTDFDFDVIKLDRSLTFDIEDRLEKQRMVALILKMLEVLGRDHVVEGIEDVPVYDFLLEIGYTQFQGYLFDEPKPIENFLAPQGQATKKGDAHA